MSRRDAVGELVIGHRNKKPYASWWCRCGTQQEAAGAAGVSRLMARYQRHATCRERPVTAWEIDASDWRAV